MFAEEQQHLNCHKKLFVGNSGRAANTQDLVLPRRSLECSQRFLKEIRPDVLGIHEAICPVVLGIHEAICSDILGINPKGS